MGNRFSKRNGDVMSAVLWFKCKYLCQCGSVGKGIFLHQTKLTLMPSYITILLLLVFSLLNVGQAATQITGTVLDADSKAPLKNALVSLKSTGDIVLTDEAGKFSISPSTGINQNVIRGKNTNSIRLKKWCTFFICRKTQYTY